MNNKLLQEKYQLINEDSPDPRDPQFQIIIGVIVEFLTKRGVNIASLDTVDKFLETFHREAVKVYGGPHVGSPWHYVDSHDENKPELDVIGRYLTMKGHDVNDTQMRLGTHTWVHIVSSMLRFKVALLGRAWRMWKARYDALHLDNPGVPGDF